MKNYANNSIKVLSYFETNNYDLFINTVINREIDKAWVKSLAENMKTRGLLRPINVVKFGNKYHVIDGGHRLEACKIAGIPVKFIVDTTVGTSIVLADINRAKQFQDKDYVKGYASAGNQNYAEYLNFKAKYGSDFKHGGIIHILTIDGGTGDTSKLFKAGKFKVGNIISVYKFVDDLLEIKMTNPREYNQEKFIQALKIMWMNPLYSHERLIKSLQKSKFARKFEGIYNIGVYLTTLQIIYNDGLLLEKRIY